MTPAEARDALTALAERVDPRPGTVRLALEGPRATLTLDNPGARNAITLQMMLQLVDALEALRDWDGATLVVQAEGPVFCSGGHLGQVRRAVADREAAVTMARAMTAVLDGLLALPVISVCALDGPAIGGGAELCTATDFRVASDRGSVHFVHASLGIAPGWGGAGRLATHLGARRALRVLAESAPLDAATAHGLELIDATGPSARDAAQALLAPMQAHPPAAIRGIKAQIVAARLGDRDGEGAAFASVWGSPDHRAALARIRAAR